MRRKLSGIPLFAGAMVVLVCLAALQTILPDRAFSTMENRALTQLDPPQSKTVLSGAWMQSAETYVADQFPGRDGWMMVQAVYQKMLMQNEQNGILIGRDGWLFEDPRQMPLRVAENSARALDALAAVVDVPVTLALVPMSSAIYPEQLPAFVYADDQEAVIRALYGLAPQLRTVDLLGALRRAKGSAQPLFFRTDHHWTDAGAAVGTDAIKGALGIAPGAEQGSAVTFGGMYGSYYARAPSPFIEAESLSLFVPDGVSLWLDGERQAGLYDPAMMAESRDKYAQVLFGNHGRLTLLGPEKNGVLLVIKDSYANLVLPRLAQHFGRVEAVDLRYFTGDLLDLINETEADQIVCLYGLTTWLTDRNLLLQSASWDD